jgi:hypothetical protein
LATITGEKSLEDRVPTAEFDPDQLERLMVAAFELLGKPEGQARELSRAILKQPSGLNPTIQNLGSRADVMLRVISKSNLCALSA